MLFRFFEILLDLLLVAVLLRKNATAVFLHIKSFFTGFLVAASEIGAKISVKKFHTVSPKNTNNAALLIGLLKTLSAINL